ncbi:MAG: 50S ribosomal protein L15, partial [Desulfovibrionaceae bacterium]|nr:50S ribosomal protein L15 [Desulfovibrionaceae bacterium]
VGRGSGSGLGKTAGRGHKGQNSRSGGGVPAGFEGGQMPLARRLPKRGFKNAEFKAVYEILNIGRLAQVFEGKSEVTLDDIYDRGLAKPGAAVKVLGVGNIESAMTIEAHRFSASAIEKIKSAGGSVKSLEQNLDV